MNSHRITSLRRLRIAGAAVLTCLTLGAAAPAANADTVHAGNRCAAFFSVNHAGSHACVNRGIISSTSITLQPGAYDYTRDGYSAANYTEIWRLRYGRWERITAITVINSSGVGTTRLSTAQRVDRVPGTTQLWISMTPCSYDGARRIYLSCAGAVTKTLNW